LYKSTDVVKVPKICTLFNSTKAGLPEGALFSVKDLVYSMLIGSAGDSACTLATGKVSYEEFVAMMNRKASLTGLSDTHFSNPIGLDDLDGQNYSTAWDLYKLSTFAVDNPVISDAVKTKSYTVNGVLGRFAANIYTTNQLLLEIPNTLGIKTGTTQGAGEVFIYEYADDKKELVIVVMGSQDRFTDTRNLLHWAEKSYSWM
jgi:serine-type D-Ala-D-Ala carboxypeptidase (penicillin-binding protein 5/6)